MGWSADFYTAIRNQVNFPRPIVVLDGVEYEEEVLNISHITRNNHLSAGTVTVTMDNTDKAFNSRITDNTWDQQRAYIRVYFEDLETEEMNIFAGIPFKVDYVANTAEIYIRDNMAKMLTRQVGTTDTAVDYYSSAYNPADLVWDILTTSVYGNLDNTESSANSDIDYTQWSAWKTDMTNQSYSLKGRFTGKMTIRDILIRVCELTDSYIWVNGDGKFEFAMQGGSSQMTGSENYTDNNIILSENLPFLSIDTDHIYNNLYTRYNYNQAEDGWDSEVDILTNLASVANYGTHTYEEIDTSIWHADGDSVDSFATAYVNRYKDPYTTLCFEAVLASWLEEVSYTVSVTRSLLNISSMTMTITEMTLMPMEGKTRMKLYWPWPHS